MLVGTGGRPAFSMSMARVFSLRRATPKGQSYAIDEASLFKFDEVVSIIANQLRHITFIVQQVS